MRLLFSQRKGSAKNKFGSGKNGKTKMTSKLTNLKSPAWLRLNNLQPKFLFKSLKVGKMTAFHVLLKPKVKLLVF
jgi:hypothetical protein